MILTIRQLTHSSIPLPSLFNELRKSEAKEEKNGFERMTNDDAESHDGLQGSYPYGVEG